MKDYIKLERKEIFDSYNRYISEKATTDLFFTLFWALDEFYYKDLFIRFLDDPEWEDQGGNEGFVEKNGDMVELYNPIDDLSPEPGEDPVPSAIISIENLKEITRDWKELYEKDSPIIYLILQDDGWIIVRESLEGDQD